MTDTKLMNEDELAVHEATDGALSPDGTYFWRVVELLKAKNEIIEELKAEMQELENNAEFEDDGRWDELDK